MNTALAISAINHTLHQIACNPAIWHHAGYGTETFYLLTKSAADVRGEPHDQVMERYMQMADLAAANQPSNQVS
jgi:hypothetical protein